MIFQVVGGPLPPRVHTLSGEMNGIFFYALLIAAAALAVARRAYVRALRNSSSGGAQN